MRRKSSGSRANSRAGGSGLLSDQIVTAESSDFSRPRRYPAGMPKRSSRKPREDAAQAAVRVMNTIAERQEKNPAAVALGHLGGVASGKKRKDNIPAAQRSEIARTAAIARWQKKKSSE
jgi:hypothetical protein